MQVETPEQFSKRSRNLLREAIKVCGDSDPGHARLNGYMMQAKTRGLTWVEGLEFAIREVKGAGSAA